MHRSYAEIKLIEITARSVSDKEIIEVREGSPWTNGSIIQLPYGDPKYSFDDLIGLAAHEGGHNRFGSILDATFPKLVCPENYRLGEIIINLFEDSRIEYLIFMAFPGYWDKIDAYNRQISARKHEDYASVESDILKTPDGAAFLIGLSTIYGAGYENIFFNKAFCNAMNEFKFKSDGFSEFWKSVNDAFRYMYTYLSPISGIIASIMYTNALRKFLNGITNYVESKEPDDKSSSLSKQQIPSDVYNPFEVACTRSGTPIKSVSKDDRDRLAKLRSALQHLDIDRVKELLMHDIMESKTDIEKIIENVPDDAEIADEKEYTYQDTFEYYEDPIEKLRVERFSDADELKKINNIADPTMEYQKVVMKYRTIIERLRYQFSSIRRSEEMERGYRRGIISQRDLVRMISTDYRFDKPFMQANNAKGADLLVLIDESGSMEGGKMQSAKECVIVISEALQGTLINFGIIGFSAEVGKMTIAEKVYKTMDEQCYPEKIGAIGYSNKFSENRDGTSFKSIAHKYFASGQNNALIMIVISDGQPLHGNTDYVGSFGMKATATAIRNLKNEGINMFALSIDPKGRDYLQKIYGNQNFIVLNDPALLREKLTVIVTNIAQELK